MAPILIQLLAVLTLIPVIGYTVFSYQRSSELVSLSQRNAARMEQVATSVRASLRPVDMNGAVRAPMGEANGQRMAVPAWIVADDRTPWGARFGYCPYSVDATGAATPPNLTTAAGSVGSGNGTYAVTTARSRGREYVLQSDAQPIRVRDEAGNETASSTAAQEVVAFIVAPPPFTGDGALPSCSDVVLSNGAWIVSPRDGRKPGTVVPVLSRGIATGQVANQGEVVLYADAAARGAGTGDAPASAIGLKDALDLWHLTPWRAATFRVAGGTYGFGTGDAVPGGTTPRLAFSTPYPGRSLAIVGDGGALAVANSGGQPIELLFTVDATLDNVALGEGVVLRVAAGARVTATRSSLRHVRIDGGDLTLGEGTSVNADAGVNPNTGILLTSGRLRLAGGTLPLVMGTGQAGIFAMGGELVLDGTGLDMTLPAGARSVTLLDGARLTVAPSAAGAMPTVRVNGQTWTVPASEVRIERDCMPGGDGSCVATCAAPGERANFLREARDGGCWASEPDADPQNPQTERNPSERASLWRSHRSDIEMGGSASSWTCRWKPGSVYAQTTVLGSTFQTYQGNAPYPALKAAARCVPSVGVEAPAAAN